MMHATALKIEAKKKNMLINLLHDTNSRIK